jgi:cytochrome c oxidase subunit 3
MDHSAAGHAGGHHWETSVYPMLISFGVFLLAPIAFGFIFEYKMMTLGLVVFLLGFACVFAGVLGWVNEAIGQKELGYALTGLPIFIVSETMIFLSLFASYWLMRLSAEVWPPAGTPEIGIGLPIVMTIILVSSSVTYHFAELKLDAGDKAGFKTWLLITMALGLTFLGCSLFEYNHLIGEGFRWGTNAKSAAFYAITGFHATHVVLGLGVFLFVLIPAIKGKTNHTFAQSAGLYWHFVDIVWFFVVSQIYFW